MITFRLDENTREKLVKKNILSELALIDPFSSAEGYESMMD